MGKTNLSKNELERTVERLMIQHDKLVAVIEALLFEAEGSIDISLESMEAIFKLDPEKRGIRMEAKEDGMRYYQLATEEDRDEALRQVAASQEARSAGDDEGGSGDPEGERGEGDDWDGRRRILQPPPGTRIPES